MTRRLAILAFLLSLCATAHGGGGMMLLPLMDAPTGEEWYSPIIAIPGCAGFWESTKAENRVMNGTTVTNWLDVSGNGLHATNVGSGVIVSPAALNGKDGISFTNAYFKFREKASITAMTVVLLFDRRKSANTIGVCNSGSDVAFPWFYTDNKIYIQISGGYGATEAITNEGPTYIFCTFETNYLSSKVVRGTVTQAMRYTSAPFTNVVNAIGRVGGYYTAGNQYVVGLWLRALTPAENDAIRTAIYTEFGL